VSAAGDRLQDTARKAALALPDVSHGRPFTPRLEVYKVADKVFLIVTDDPEEQIITVKCEPEHARHWSAATPRSPRAAISTRGTGSRWGPGGASRSG
jgi:predicted DNA-binding protein (MmcQ/YjbR family)